MNEQSPDGGTSNGTPDSAAVLQSMTLLATLSTAEEVREAVDERRAGRDPSAQAPSSLATTRLHNARESLLELLMQLVLGRVPFERNEEGRLAHAVRHFDLLMKLRRAERLVKAMHQDLLSLYPEVSESLVEEARHVHREIRGLLDTASAADDGGPALPDVLERGLSFAVWTRHEV
jgi:phosphate uptake regulator